jgi:hypothetical protein
MGRLVKLVGRLLVLPHSEVGEARWKTVDAEVHASVAVGAGAAYKDIHDPMQRGTAPIHCNTVGTTSRGPSEHPVK